MNIRQNKHCQNVADRLPSYADCFMVILLATFNNCYNNYYIVFPQGADRKLKLKKKIFLQSSDYSYIDYYVYVFKEKEGNEVRNKGRILRYGKARSQAIV